MGNINDFKIVNQKSLIYSHQLPQISTLPEYDQMQIGFYFLVLECVTNNKEFIELQNMIIDDKFCKDVFGKGNDDLGIDAVNIDEEKKVIQLFNFKFRKNFKEDASTKEGDVYDCTRFLSAICEENTAGLSPRTKEKIERIISLYNSTEIYNMELYMIANVNEQFPEGTGLKRFKDHFSLSIKSILLDDISNFISDTPVDKTASLFVDVDSVLTYETNSYSTQKSFLLKLSIADLIRITCNDEAIRNNTSLDYALLNGTTLDMSLLYDNVRGYLGETKFNKNIVDTLDLNPEKFFMFNNGITITSKSIISSSQNGNKKIKIDIQGYQIVNGGQTLRSIYKFISEKFDQEKIATAEILIRLFKTDDKDELKNDIAEYTNSQNAINCADLKSISNMQRQIETYLDTKCITYIRKSGDLGLNKTLHPLTITMERLAQIIYSDMGFPTRAINYKKRIFDDYYNQIFSESLELEHIETLIRRYHNIKAEYSNSDFNGYDIKVSYIIYMLSKKPDTDIHTLVVDLENLCSTFEPGNTSVRKLFKGAFLNNVNDYLDS